MEPKKQSIARLDKDNVRLVCGVCGRADCIGWVSEMNDKRTLCLPRSYNLMPDGVWQPVSRKLPNYGRPKPVREPQASPIRAMCRNCGSVQFIYLDRINAGLLPPYVAR